MAQTYDNVTIKVYGINVAKIYDGLLANDVVDGCLSDAAWVEVSSQYGKSWTLEEFARDFNTLQLAGSTAYIRFIKQ